MTTIITKNSSTAGAVPLAGDLVQGEIAVNVTDKKLYTKNASGSVVQITPTVNDNGFKNRIINGAMMIDQRNAGAAATFGSGTTANNYYGFSLDRWFAQSFSTATGNGAAFTVQRTSSAPTGFANALTVTVTSAQSTLQNDSLYRIQQPIEGYNFADMAFGTASAATITISFWVKSNLTGTFSGTLCNDTNATYPFTYTINAANTWEYKTVTIAGYQSGTWNTTNGVGAIVIWCLGAYSGRLGTAGAWVSNPNIQGATGQVNLMATVGNNFSITGAQLEKGSTATSFDYRPYGTELQLCQRYCQMLAAGESNGNYLRYAYGECAAPTYLAGNVNLLSKMRITPSLTTTTASQYGVFSRGSVTTCTAMAIGTDGSSPSVANVNATVASGLTQGSAGSAISNNNQTSYMLFTAEL